MKKPKLVTIRGKNGVGKTTVGDMLARERGFVFLRQDYFEHDMQPGRPNDSARHKFADTNLRSCLQNSMEQKENIILEGAFANINKEISDLNLLTLIDLAQSCGYEVTSIMLDAKNEVTKKRMAERGNEIHETIYKQIAEELELVKIENEVVIQTDTLTASQTVKKILEVI